MCKCPFASVPNPKSLGFSYRTLFCTLPQCPSRTFLIRLHMFHSANSYLVPTICQMLSVWIFGTVFEINKNFTEYIVKNFMYVSIYLTYVLQCLIIFIRYMYMPKLFTIPLLMNIQFESNIHYVTMQGIVNVCLSYICTQVFM